MTEMRKDRRAPASLKVKYKSATVDDFIEQFGTDVSRGGIFIKTKKPLETGALLKFEFQLQNGSAVLHGVGRVAWRRLEQNARPDLPAGMGIKFFKLSDHSRVVVERIESRSTGQPSRYEQTDAAEFAAPLSGAPPSFDSGPKQMPNGKRPLGQGSGPLTLPPPPAVSSVPPALAQVPPARPFVPSKPAQRIGSPGLPKGTLGSFFPDNQPRKSGSPGNRTRDASEFLASAFQAGAGPEVRAQARAQAERARRDPESVNLARELFGDQNAGTPTAPPPPAATTAQDMARSSAVTPVPDHFSLATPVPAVELPRAAAARSSRPSADDRVPSLEQLVDEASKPGSGAPSRRISDRTSADIGDLAKGDEHVPLTLAISVPTGPITSADSPAPSGRSRVLLWAALVSTLTLGGLAVYIGMQRGAASDAQRSATAEQAAQPSAPAQAAQPEPPAEAPAPPPTAANEPAQPAAPEPAVAGPPVPVKIEAKPRGAEVLVAGTARGSAPQRLSLPSNVAVEITVRSPGYATTTRSITPREGMAAEQFELAPLNYELVVQTDPEGATVSANGKSAVSPAPLELGHIAGVLNISVEKEGFQRSKRSVKLDEFSERDGAMRGEISVKLNALPSSARRRAPRETVPSDAPPPEPGASPEAPVMQVRPAAEAAPEPPSQAAPEPTQAKPAPTPAPEAPPDPPSPSTP